MWQRHYKEINEDLKRTRKAIIALGCSFVQGQGAVNTELYENYEWILPGQGEPIEPKLNAKEKKLLLKKYPELERNLEHDKIDFTFMEHKNAFVNVLCKKYFNAKWTPINFGMKGCGNRATIKELYLNKPYIDLDLADEIIVIYCPSGPERFDFINDTFRDHFRFIGTWPWYESLPKGSGRRALWEGYYRTVYSYKEELIEQILNVQELLTWCETKKAKLIIIPAFDKRYDKEYFKKTLGTTYSRENEIAEPVKTLSKHRDKDLVELFPWDKMYKPGGYNTFAELVMSQEELEDSNDYYFQFLETGSKNNWITPCAHPSQKAHDLFASYLYQHIRENYEYKHT